MKRSAIIIACLAVAALILVTVSAVAWRLWEDQQRTVYTDGDTIRYGVSNVVPRDILWQPPTSLLPSINTSAHEYEPRISRCERILLFVRGKPGENADICISRRNDQLQWADSLPLVEINTEFDELGPELSADGLTLYFHSNRPGGMGGYDLWKTHQVEGQWQPPVNCGPGINSTHNEYGAALTPDGMRLYFASNRPLPGEVVESQQSESWSATLRENHSSRHYDLYIATRDGDEFGSAMPLHAINSEYNEGSPAISPAGDFLYFCSDRPGGVGRFDLYRSRILRGENLSPSNLGSEINTTANEMDPALATGGFAIYFSSDRTTIDDEIAAAYDIYQSAAREVFTETAESEQWIDWASITPVILDYLWWLLLALLALLLALALLRRMRTRQMTLFARCLLASIIAHLIIMMLLTFWHVTVSIANAMDRGGTRVHLTHASHGAEDVTHQIRSMATDAQLELQTAASAQAETELSFQLPATMFAVMPQTSIEREQLMPIELEVLERPEIPPTIVTTAPTVPDIQTSEAAETLAVHTPSAEPLPSAAEPTVQTPSMTVATESARASTSPVPSVTQVTITVPVVTPSSGRAADEHIQTEMLMPADRVPTSIELPPIAMAVDAVDVPVPETSVEVSIATPSESERAVQSDEPVVRMPADAHASETTRTDTQPTTAPVIESLAEAVQGVAATRRLSADEAPVSLATPIGTEHVPDIAASAMAVDINIPDIGAPAAESLVVDVDTPNEKAQRTAVNEEQTDEASIDVVVASPSASQRNDSAPRIQPMMAETVVASPSASPVRSRAESDRAIAIELPTSNDSTIERVSPSAMEHSDKSLLSLSPALLDIAGEPASIDIAIPTEIAPPVEQYVQRAEDIRRDLVEQMGGSDATERAVALALKWLAAHQSENGRWAAKRFDDDCGNCRGAGKFDTDVATTGLALLCFMGANHTHQKESEYKAVVKRGLNWLIAQQEPDGDLRGGETMYSHGIAAIALAEAYGITRDPSLLPHVQSAIDFICDPRNQRAGGWRYEPGQPGDTSVLGWQIMALHSAKSAGIHIPHEMFDIASRWLDTVSTPTRRGHYAYQPGHRFTPSMTAEGMFVQQLLGVAPSHERMQASATYILENEPNWRNGAHTYYWYYATLAMFQHQGEPWQEWNEALTEQLLANQRTSGAAAGSWDPADNWSRIGGRIYQTALCTLCLEVYYRYLPMYGAKRSE